MEGRKKHGRGAFETARRRRGYGAGALVGAAVAAAAAFALVYLLVTLLMPSATGPSPTGEVSPGGDAARAASVEPARKAPEGGSDEEKPKDDEPAEEKPEMPVAPPPAPERSCDDLRVLVDRQHTLPPYYGPADLVSLAAYGVPVMQGTDLYLRQEAAGQLAKLMAAAAADGEELVVASAYRSYAEQQGTYARYTAMYGEGAGSVSAPPGQSQHQLGTAVDFTNSAAGYRLWWPFGDTTASAWLVENAPEYGYVLAYPKGIEEETGYQYEPWHYRYVGKENVRLMQENDVSLQSFLVQQNVVPKC
jgi:LAS superfamily LD-carboxypeptidase LdcB